MSDYSRERYPDAAPSVVAALADEVIGAAHNVLAAGARLFGAAGETAVQQVVSQPVVERYPGNIVA